MMKSAALLFLAALSHAQSPKEIPVPLIATSAGTLPGVTGLPIRLEMPDVMVTASGQRVTTIQQWRKRREEIKRILSYYAVGQMPPPPGNVKGVTLKSELVAAGRVRY
ncbi:MAG: hypothetical protein SFV51_07110, partial [Bryobacteraceae bacterium]|nr:hypothetical protein [Bryobacteraceae bacterium]